MVCGGLEYYSGKYKFSRKRDNTEQEAERQRTYGRALAKTAKDKCPGSRRS